MRITKKILEGEVAVLNDLARCRNQGGQWRFGLSWANGGVQLVREFVGTTTTEPINDGHWPKSELDDYLQGLIRGMLMVANAEARIVKA